MAIRRRAALPPDPPDPDTSTSTSTDDTLDLRTVPPRRDLDIPVATFAEYVSYAYTLRAQIVRGEVSLGTLSFRQLFNLYLLTSILYYRHDVGFIPDPVFDRICEILVERKEEVETSIFWHGRLFDLEMLKAGSGFHLRIDNTPIYLQNAAMVISESRQGPWEAVAPEANTSVTLPVRKRKRLEPKQIEIDFKPKRRRATL